MQAPAPSPERQDVPVISDTDPVVSMSRAYGKVLCKGEILEFDYAAFHSTARSLGIEEDGSCADLSISLRPSKVFLQTNGGYDSRKTSIDLVAKPSHLPRAHRGLRHETFHYAEDTNGKLSAFSKNGGGGAHGQTLAPFIVANAANLLITFHGPSEKVPTTTLEKVIAAVSDTPHHPYTALIIPAISLVALSGYLMSSAERRARRAEKLDTPPVLSIRKEVNP